VSPAATTLCAWAIDFQGADCVPAALSLPLGETFGRLGGKLPPRLYIDIY
jgi:hypothetical protein